MTAGIHKTEILIIRPILAVTEPTALPIAISFCPFAAAIDETRSSGSVVAKLTTVAPIMNFGIPVASAIHVAASTKTSPPLTISTRPITNKITSWHILVMLTPKRIKVNKKERKAEFYLTQIGVIRNEKYFIYNLN